MSIPVTIKYQADDALSGEGYVEINGTKYRASKGKSDTNLTLSNGDEIIFCIWTRYSSIVVDGETIIYLDLSSNGSYHTITVDDTMSAIEIQFKEVGTGISMVTTFTVTITKAAAKTHKTRVDNVGWPVTGGRCLVDGVGYGVKKGRTLADGVGYDVAFGASGTPAGDIAVGSSVYANVNGVRTEFLVVHQGLPSSMYDDSCDGTWLLVKTVQADQPWNTGGNNDYKASSIHNYLNGTIAGSFDENVLNKVKTAKIPYVNGAGSAGTVLSGGNGLSAKFFLLSIREMYSGSHSSIKIDGSVLDYFLPGTLSSDAKRIGYNASGNAANWWPRTPYSKNNYTVTYVYRSNGNVDSYTRKVEESCGVRFACILDSSAAIDPDTFDILG